MNQTWQITKITEQQALDAAGKVTKLLAVQFTVGPHGPFTELISRADFMAGQLNGRIAQFAAQIAGLPQGNGQ
jgi:hypothetical protein